MEGPITIVDDPTPKLEASQESLLVTTLRDISDANIEIVESVLTDESGQHPRERVENTGRGISTIYCALQRLKAVVKNGYVYVSFASRKFADEVQAIVGSTEHQIENAADRQRGYPTWTLSRQRRVHYRCGSTYGAEVLETVETGRMKIRIDTILSQLKSSNAPRLPEVLAEGRLAWIKRGYDIQEFNEARIEWGSGPARNEKLLRVKTVR